MIVPRLRAIQDEFGYLPDDELKKLAQSLGVPLSKIQDVAGFFPHFRQEWNQPPSVEVKICRDVACHRAGAPRIYNLLKQAEKKGELEVEGVSCLGRCDRAVACTISRHTGNHPFHDNLYTGRTPFEMESLVGEICDGLNVPGVTMTRTSLFDAVLGKGLKPKAHSDQPPPTPDHDADFFIDRSDWQIDPYAAGEFPKYAAVKKLVTETPPVPSNAAEKPHPWLDILNAAGLLGMGGAGVPAYRKWFDVWKATPADGSGEKYIVCNGDESEPSTFKDREILLHMPHVVVEGVILAGLLTNAKAGYIYIRHEYHEQIEAVKAAIAEAEVDRRLRRRNLRYDAELPRRSLRVAGRVRVRRTECSDRGDGRPTLATAKQAARTQYERPPRPTHRRQQRRNPRLDPGRIFAWR